MIPVFQTRVNKKDGDCMRACIASLLELHIDQVPNFVMFGANWFDVFYYFMYSNKYIYCGNAHFDGRKLLKEDSIKGDYYACVPSLLYPELTHSVVMNNKGICVHDPNPSGLYLGQSLHSVLHYWYVFERKE
jgi:hypothetical protein